MAKTTKKKSILREDMYNEAISIVNRERTNWEDAVTYITDGVGFRMKQLIRILRKNYWGVFDQPIDEQTGREKVWIGLAMSLVETWVKNTDLSSKDMNFIARGPKGYEITDLTRLVFRDYLDRIYYGESLDADERQVLIDGTLVRKTWEDNSTGKPVMKTARVDLLNFYIDPTAEDIQSAYRVTERTLMLPSQIAGMTGWYNTEQSNDEDLQGSQVLNPNDANRKANFGTKTTAMYRDVWEMWGKIPKWLVTGDKKAPDAMSEIDGHVIISGLETPGPVCHLIEENKKTDHFGNIIKPYEEWRVAKIAGRWYGLGIIERILALQEYLNTTVNIRINRGYVSQLGLFKIKKGKGITAQMLNRLPVNGAIQVQDMDDVQQMSMSEVGQSSYNDEDVIKYWAQQITSAMPISNGDILPASTTATATATASASAKSAYVVFKEGAGFFHERWIDRHALPIVAKTVTKGKILTLTNADPDFKELIQRLALNRVSEHLDKSNLVPSPQELEMELQREIERLQNSPQIFIEQIQDIIASEVYAKVKITNEDLDSSATIQNLLTIMQIAPEHKDEILKQVYDLMGLMPPKMTSQAPQQQVPQPNIPTNIQPSNATNVAMNAMNVR